MSAPAPLTPPDCDLRDFPFMPFYVARFRDSDLVAARSLEEIGAAAILWAAAWHQVPAASLPNNDAALSRLIGFGRDIDAFLRVKAGALHGYVLCSDGRLHHPVAAQAAVTAWEGKLHRRWMTELSRVKKHNQRHGTKVVPPSLDEFIASGCHRPRLPVPGDSPGTSLETGPGNGLQRERDRERDTEEEENPLQTGAEVIQLGAKT